MTVREYYFYMMASYRRALYAGVTNDLTRPVYEHQQKFVEGFTKNYNVTKLVYYEAANSIEAAFEREKQVKGWLRSKKIAIIESVNPYWEDLAKEWYQETPTAPDPSAAASEPALSLPKW